MGNREIMLAARECFTRRFLYPLNLRQRGITPSALTEWTARDNLSRRELQEIQGRELTSFLEYAAENCPYYQRQFANLGVRPSASDPFDELRKLPPLTKDEIRAHANDMVSKQFAGARGLIKKATGGSTGTPLTVWGDREDYRINGLVIARQRRWIGWEGGIPTMTLFGGFRDLPGRTTRLLKRFLIQDHWINIMDPNQVDYQRILHSLRRSPPKALVAYFSILQELARAAESTGEPLRGLSLAIACAEPLDETARDHAEFWLGSPLFFQYGCREVGTFAQECRCQEGYHFAMDAAYCEVLQGDRDPFEPGDLLITWFPNRVMPLFRYHIGDAARLTREPCACGLPYDRLRTIDGRSSTMAVDRNGRRFTTMLFPHLFKDVSWIHRFQVEQPEPGNLIIRLAGPPDRPAPSEITSLESRLANMLGSGFSIQWRWNETFIPVPTGKHVYFLSTEGFKPD